MTGRRSCWKQAFINAEATVDQKLAEGTLSEFGLVVCDVNGLKHVNDTKGHKAGDEYIRQACRMACDIFSHSPVYRIGGDEFTVILTDRDYENYDVYYAADGVETMKVLQSHKDEVDLVLLDLFMPNMNGREVLMQMQVSEELASIPVIVLTVDEDAQVDCLKYGAMDFIPKPYPDIEIVKARIAKCIELSENRDLIRQTQREPNIEERFVRAKIAADKVRNDSTTVCSFFERD